MDWLFGFASSACFQGQYSFFANTEDYRLWAKGRSPQANMYAYFDMVRERDHANRLEF